MQTEYEATARGIEEKGKLYVVDLEEPVIPKPKASDMKMEVQEMDYPDYMLDTATITSWKIEDNQTTIDQIGKAMHEIHQINNEMAKCADQDNGKLDNIVTNTRSTKENAIKARKEIEITRDSRSG